MSAKSHGHGALGGEIKRPSRQHSALGNENTKKHSEKTGQRKMRQNRAPRPSNLTHQGSLREDVASKDVVNHGLMKQGATNRDKNGETVLVEELPSREVPNPEVPNPEKPDQEITTLTAVPSERTPHHASHDQGTARTSLSLGNVQQGTSLAAPAKDDCETTSAQTHRYDSPVPLIKMCAAIIAVIGIVILITSWRTVASARPVERRVEICRDAYCLQHAFALKMTWNASAHPCDNFYEFACGAWAASQKHPRLADLATAARSIALGELLSDSGPPSKVAKFFKSCTEADIQSNLGAFKAWASKMGVIVPRNSSRVHDLRRDPLDLLLDLAINWRMGLLSIRVTKRFRRGQILIIRAVPETWRPILQREDLKSLVEQHAELLDTPPPSNRNEWDKAVAAILNATSDTLFENQWDDTAHEIAGLDALTPSLPKGSWLGLINGHFAQEIKFQEHDIVHVYDQDVLSSIGELFETQRHESLTEVFSWLFVETHFAIIGVHTEHPDRNDEKRWHEPVCLEYTNTYLGLLSVQNYIRRQFPPDKRKSINETLGHIRSTWVLNFERAPWVDIASKQRALRKLEALDTDLWPAEEFFDRNATEALYGGFPSMDGPFTSNLFNTARALRRLVAHTHAEDVFLKRMLGENHLFAYRYNLNQVYIDLAALAAPVYYDLSMYSVVYGGLGSLYAKEIARMYDSTGRTLGPEGETYISSPDAEETPEYQKRWRCNATGDDTGAADRPSIKYFTHTSGLETAFYAYGVAASSYSKFYDYRLETLDEFTGDEIFFMTFCHVLCAPEADDQARDACNVPLRNFRPFGKAFRCPLGSYMNPAEKCTFFAEDEHVPSSH